LHTKDIVDAKTEFLLIRQARLGAESPSSVIPCWTNS